MHHVNHKEAAIFLFAHQDDETAVFQTILYELGLNRQVLCFYLTTGVKKGRDSDRRNNESISVLLKLGIASDDIHFVGDLVDISDGELMNRLDIAEKWLVDFVFAKHGAITRIYLPSWEGGHPDHDVLHALAVNIGQKHSLLDCMRQYSLYNGYHCPGPLFRTFFPIPENGEVESVSVSWGNRFKFLKYCLQYPSQTKTWLGLFPMMFFHYVLWGTQNLQKVSMQRIFERPHEGALYYERRKFSTFDVVRKNLLRYLMP